MVADVKQTADGNYLLAQNFPDCEFKAVLPVYPHRRNALFIAFQHFVVQRIVIRNKSVTEFAEESRKTAFW